MEQTKLDCAIVRDLLPGYVDSVTSEATNAAVEAHICDCAACRDILIAMRTEFEPPSKAAPEVDYLKKQQDAERRRKRNYSLVYLGLILLVVCELCIQLYPLWGATGKDYGKWEHYPVTVMTPEELKACAVLVDGVKIYRIELGDPIWQSATVEITPDGIDAKMGGRFLKGMGKACNVVGDTIYVELRGIREGILTNLGNADFGFAIRLQGRQAAELWD